MQGNIKSNKILEANFKNHFVLPKYEDNKKTQIKQSLDETEHFKTHKLTDEVQFEICLTTEATISALSQPHAGFLFFSKQQMEVKHLKIYKLLNLK